MLKITGTQVRWFLLEVFMYYIILQDGTSIFEQAYPYDFCIHCLFRLLDNEDERYRHPQLMTFSLSPVTALPSSAQTSLGGWGGPQSTNHQAAHRRLESMTPLGITGSYSSFSSWLLGKSGVLWCCKSWFVSYVRPSVALYTRALQGLFEVIIWNFYCYLLFGYLVVLFVVPDLKTVFLIGLTQFIAVAIFLGDIMSNRSSS